MTENPSTTTIGTVEEIIKPRVPNEPERAQIAVEEPTTFTRNSVSKIHLPMPEAMKSNSRWELNWS